MSKHVKIPDYTWPSWSCSINGVKYSYPAGTVQEVPDAVASFVESLRVASQKKEAIIPPFGGTLDPKIVCTATGCPISLKDSARHGLMGLKIYGKTTQNGEPSPDAPVALDSVGDSGSVGVTVVGIYEEPQYLTIQTPNGLPGIPVTSGGNYTDENGQQWICDELDFARGEYIQRIARRVYTGREVFQHYGTDGVVYTEDFTSEEFAITGAIYPSFCSHLPYNPEQDLTGGKIGHRFRIGEYAQNRLYFAHPNFTSLAAFLSFVSGAFELGAPLTVEYILHTPRCFNLAVIDPDALAQYSTMHTVYPNTTIYNDAGAGVGVTYIADTKRYIDEKFAELSSALLSNS